MDSWGKFSKWLSNDSIPVALSESEQTEDEADTFSDREGHGAGGESLSADEYDELSSYLGPTPLRLKGDQSKDCSDDTECPDSGPRATALPPVTSGDRVFAQKCADLHRFNQPLLELLDGLKTGRFDKGLTSLQQSVAIDRLQRILGVLQRPHMGEKYLQHLLQIEMMLKIWFPHIAYPTLDNSKGTKILPPHWCQSQLHIPVKKRKLSCLEQDHTSHPLTKHEQHHQKNSCHHCQVSTSVDTVSTCGPGSLKKRKTTGEEETECSCSVAHVFTDSPEPLGRASSRQDNRKQTEISPPSHCDSQATQDSFVSSSVTGAASESP
ncbi:circadian associated repressor of transcription a isoform X2 [Cynoglossus semilaevis]|uniref:Circadian associated repressor of transcription a n=2 Tax=Cynoglossus semilaevis TaxID=244447 RepID=A0A3P8VA74_CYNSE|nr:circadian-associated transcriptional repressor isoform X2 [Cynoglossus semilaevis]